MIDDQKFEEAKVMINTFAEQLLSLNGGKEIPLTWKNYLVKAIRPLPGKPGRKIDYKKVTKMVKRIAFDLNNINAKRTKNHNPAEFKKRIAKEFGVSQKTVDRIKVAITKIFMDQGIHDAEMRKASIEGIAEFISNNLDTAAAKEQEVWNKRAKIISKLPPPK